MRLSARQPNLAPLLGFRPTTVALTACLAIHSSLSAGPMAYPPASNEPALIFGDGRFGEVWRIAGLPTTRDYGRAIAVNEGSLCITAIRQDTSPHPYIDFYERGRSGWSLVWSFEPTSDPEFGASISLEADRAAVVGKSVRIFSRDSGVWSVEGVVPLSSNEGFGGIALRGNTIAVGRPLRDGSSTNQGGIDLLTLGATGWTLTGTIPNPQPAPARQFGHAVMWYGDQLVVSAPYGDGTGGWQGAIYRFQFTRGSWGLAEAIEPTASPWPWYGYSLATDGETIVVGSPIASPGAMDGGAVEVLSPTARGFTRQTLHSSLPAWMRQFGRALAVRAGELIVGAPSFNSSPSSGFAERFTRGDDGTWTWDRLLFPTPTMIDAPFTLGAESAAVSIGAAVAIDPITGERVIAAPDTYVDGVPSVGYVVALAEDLPDCNGNGIGDASEVLGSFHLRPSRFSPIAPGEVVEVSLPTNANPVGAVRVTTVAMSNTSGGVVRLNGTKVGDIYQNPNGSGCERWFGPNQVVIPLATYQSIVGTGTASLAFELFPTSSTCDPPADSFLVVEVRYPVEGDELDLDGSTSLDGCQDCDGNGVADVDDIAAGALDCDGNWVPDACEELTDCNGNGIDDACEFAAGTAADCNGNLRPDECDIADGLATDCNVDGVPDTCGLVAAGSSTDDSEYTLVFSGTTNVLRLQRLMTTSQTETIVGLSVQWSPFCCLTFPPPSTPMTLLIMSDPDQDGSPADATLLAWNTVALGTPDKAVFYDYVMPTTVIGPTGTSFFVGVYHEPIPLQLSRLVGVDCDQLEPDSAFYAAELATPPMVALDPAEIMAFPPDLPSGAWMIRGLGADAVACLAADSADVDGDGVVGPSDLAILLGNWGTAGPGDLDGDGVVGAGDLASIFSSWTV